MTICPDYIRRKPLGALTLEENFLLEFSGQVQDTKNLINRLRLQCTGLPQDQVYRLVQSSAATIWHHMGWLHGMWHGIATLLIYRGTYDELADVRDDAMRELRFLTDDYLCAWVY